MVAPEAVDIAERAKYEAHDVVAPEAVDYAERAQPFQPRRAESRVETALFQHGALGRNKRTLG